MLDDFRELELLDGRSRELRKARPQDKGHEREVRAFVEAVRRGSPPVPLAEVANVSAATLAVVESLRTSATVLVSPD